MTDSNNLKTFEKSLPSYCYYKKSFFKNELENIWNKSWVYVCHESSLIQKLSFKTLKIGSHSIIVLRDKNNKLKAFINTCRHRGSILCETSFGKLSSNLIVCPYHQWSYDVDDGALKKTSSFIEPEGFQKKNYSLFSVKINLWRGCIFINLTDNINWNLKTNFQRSPKSIANHPIEKMIVGHVWQKEINCNWKIFWENFNECLHCPNVHPELTELVPVFSRRIMNIKDHPDWQKHFAI